MVRQQLSCPELVPDNIRCNPETIDNNAMLSEQKITPLFEDVFPIFITGQVVIADVEIEIFERLENGKDW
jgi:hypothetical protein